MHPLEMPGESPGVGDNASSNPSSPVGKPCATFAVKDAEGSCVDDTRRACEAEIDDIRAVLTISMYQIQHVGGMAYE